MGLPGLEATTAVRGDLETGRRRGRMLRALRLLYPGYFAMVMATGIVSIATARLGLPAVSELLLWIASITYGVLVALFGIRGYLFGRQVLQDLLAPKTMFTFFTFVAGSDVLAVRLSMTGQPVVAGVLAATGGIAWACLSYCTFGALFLVSEKPLVEVVNGGWLIAVVATQAVAISLGTLWHGTGVFPLFAALSLWCVGLLLYVVLITIIILRLGFFRVSPHDLSPPYWINMGATAISTVAAAELWARSPSVPLLRPVVPGLYVAMVGLWAWGTWWIPLLILMGVWKYGLRRLPFSYEPGLWSMVFPLGMYTVATLDLAEVTGLRSLAHWASVMLWVALCAWALTAGAGGYAALRRIRTADGETSAAS